MTLPTPVPVPRQLLDLEALLRQLTAEHHVLLGHVEAHQAAMARLDVRAMEAAKQAQEASRSRVASMEQRRRGLVRQIAQACRLPAEPKIPQLADLFPGRRVALLAAREELRLAVAAVATRSHIANRVAGAVLGHLNTAMRIFAGAVEPNGVYTKHGTPRVAGRIGLMEAVG